MFQCRVGYRRAGFENTRVHVRHNGEIVVARSAHRQSDAQHQTAAVVGPYVVTSEGPQSVGRPRTRAQVQTVDDVEQATRR